ncbi:MAG: hypothetical protein ACSLFD_07980 [Solirubrobacterales bacterium]
MRALVQRLNQQLGPIFNGHGLTASVSGVFCHQSPYVDLLPPVSLEEGCELGDLLVVAHYRGPHEDEIVSLLLQAKMKSFPDPSNSDPQWRLYNEWPRFKWRHDPEYVRWPKPSGPHLGAQHMVLYPDARMAAKCRMPDPSVPSTLAADEICDALVIKSGRRIKGRLEARAERGGGWSELVWDLIDQTALKALNRARTGVGEAPRVSGTVPLARWVDVPKIFLQATGDSRDTKWADHPMSDEDYVVPPYLYLADMDDQPPNGISMLIIEVGPNNAD